VQEEAEVVVVVVEWVVVVVVEGDTSIYFLSQFYLYFEKARLRKEAEPNILFLV
jgi:hypothetical protein